METVRSVCFSVMRTPFKPILSTRTPCGKFFTSIGTRPVKSRAALDGQGHRNLLAGMNLDAGLAARDLQIRLRRHRDPPTGRTAGVDLLRRGEHSWRRPRSGQGPRDDSPGGRREGRRRRDPRSGPADPPSSSAVDHGRCRGDPAAANHSALTSIGPSKPSIRSTFIGTSVVPPRGMFGFSAISSTRNAGSGRRRTRW